MTPDEIDRYRSAVFAHFAAESPGHVFIKTHSANIRNSQGAWFVPRQRIYRVIYLIRNPLDVCVSIAYHFLGGDLDEAIALMNSNDIFISRPGKSRQLSMPQKSLTCSENVNSWESLDSSICQIFRYEDLITEPHQAFGRMVRFLGWDPSDQCLDRALELSSFDRLQKLEQTFGFKEKWYSAQRFFRTGKSGSWKNELSPEQVDRIILAHGEVMRRYGYAAS